MTSRRRYFTDQLGPKFVQFVSTRRFVKTVGGLVGEGVADHSPPHYHSLPLPTPPYHSLPLPTAPYQVGGLGGERVADVGYFPSDVNVREFFDTLPVVSEHPLVSVYIRYYPLLSIVIR